MTCIVGIVKNKKVYIGGDSAFISGWGIVVRPDEKVFQRDGITFGCAGSPRAANLLRYHLRIPEPSGNDLLRYMATDFVNAMRDCFKEGGYAERENEAESISSVFLIGVLGRLFECDSDYQMKEVRDYAAIGSGEDAALGALFATRQKAPIARIQIALEAAEAYSWSVRGPFHILKC